MPVQFTNNWTPAMDTFHLQCVQKCQGYAWMHFRASAFYNKLFLGLTMPAAILSVLAGSAGLASLSQITDDPLWWLFAIIFAINITIGVLNAVSTVLEPNTTAYKHHELASDFVKLARKLQTELATEPLQRIECGDFTEMTNIEYENLMKNDIAVPFWIVRRFEQSIDDNIALPEMILDRGMVRNIFAAGMTKKHSRSVSAAAVSLDSFRPARVDPPTPRQDRPKKVSAGWMQAWCQLRDRHPAAPQPDVDAIHDPQGAPEGAHAEHHGAGAPQEHLVYGEPQGAQGDEAV